jgi:hypothetical protein
VGSTIRQFDSEIPVEPDPTNGLAHTSAAQSQPLRAITPRRITAARGHVGPAVLAQIHEAIAVLLDLSV